MSDLRDSLIHLRPRDHTVYCGMGRTVLAAAPDGFLYASRDEGLWVYQTRMLSRYRWLINGKQPEFSAGSAVEQHSWLGYYVAPLANCKEAGFPDCSALQQTLELRITRSLGEGMHEDIDLTNHTQISTRVKLELEVDSDFADPKEAEEGKRHQQGVLTRNWRATGDAWELAFDYRAEHAYEHQGEKGVARMHRGLKLCLQNAGSPPQYRQGTISFDIELPPHGAWHACLLWLAQVEDNPLPLEHGCYALGTGGDHEWERKQEQFLRGATNIVTPQQKTLGAEFSRLLERSRRDLIGLRLYDQDQGEHGWTLAAGRPTYVGLFGRDSLAASWESLLLSAEMTRGSLAALARYQGTKVDNWRDEQPGCFPHELHTNPLSVLNYDPHGLYYGGVTGSLYYPTLVAGLWHWTGDKDMVRPFIEPALRGLRWADQFSDFDNDGFYEYMTLSDQGEKNQGWKDSDDAIVYRDGREVQDPLGTCEMQAFAYASKLHFSEVLWWLGETDLAKKLYRESQELRRRFNDAFWMEDEGYIAMGLDVNKRHIDSIGSDPGHCLVSGIVDEALVPRIARRMMQPDLFSGWGIRTLSSDHPAYNPFSYHRGTVWPVENAVFVLAFARYGLHADMHRLARAQVEVATLFQHYRLPEVFAGHARDRLHPFPAMYNKANWPQAWSASAPFTILQALLGIYPYAPLDVLFLDPHLPEWLPEVELQRMRIGQACVSLRFRRQTDGRTDWEITDLEGPLHVIQQPSPWSLTSNWAERVHDMITSLLPGKLRTA